MNIKIDKCETDKGRTDKAHHRRTAEYHGAKVPEAVDPIPDVLKVAVGALYEIRELIPLGHPRTLRS